MTGKALFVGLSTLDIAYLVPTYPLEDSKTRAIDQYIGAGGPAANAAVAYAFLSNQAPTLLTALGQHTLTELVRADLTRHGVEILNAASDGSRLPPISSIFIAQESESRTVVSLDATRTEARYDNSFTALLHCDVDIVLIDGHYAELSMKVAQNARQLGIPVLLDAGRWKENFTELLPMVDIVICSSVFRPPDIGEASVDAKLDFVHSLGPHSVAITSGPQPILYSTTNCRGETVINDTLTVDTLAAGDILHGAFCYYYSREHLFVEALEQAARVATASCKYFGPREWMNHATTLDLPDYEP